MKELLRRPVALCFRVAIVALTLVVVGMGGCSDDGALPHLGGGNSGGAGFEAGPCSEGSTRECGITLAKHGNVATCYKGTETCTGGSWGPCTDGTVTEQAFEPPPSGGSQPQALGPPSKCRNNPCDPFCQNYVEDSGGITTTAEAGLLFDWRSGSLPNVPAALANKGLHQPCRSGSDCQFNHRCQDVATPQSCGHSKCRTGVGLTAGCDSCVDLICAQDSSCCKTCEHSVCNEGVKLSMSCGSCVTAVCNVRPSCCTTSWDSQCVAQVAASCPATMCGCAPGELEFEGHCYALDTHGDTWSDERNFCKDHGTGWDLVAIGSQAEQNFVRTNAGDQNMWIGYTDSATEGTWVWSNGSASTYQNWWRQPDGSGDCVRFDGATGTWDDRACTDLRQGLCERASTPCPFDATQYGTSCYHLLGTTQTWQSARTSCQARGTGWDLAKIDSSAENAFIEGFVTGPSGWIGLNDNTTEGTFVWADGTAPAYQNWTRIEPDSFGADCAYMEVVPGQIDDGFWKDLDCGTNRIAFCEGPTMDAGWGQSCVDKVKSACDASCSTSDPPSRAGVCVPWLPGQTDTTCAGIDLAVGIPCAGGVVPVCNQGMSQAPPGIKIAHFPAAAGQFAKCNPDLAQRNDPDTCVTTEPIPAGKCVNVTCPSLQDTNEIVVNPPGAGHQTECSCLDNWSIYSSSVACGDPACSGGVSQAIFQKVNLFIAFDKSGSMAGTRWNGSVAALTSFFQDPATSGLGVALEYFGLDPGLTVNGVPTGDGCGSGINACNPTPCATPMIQLNTLTAAAAPADTQEDRLIRSLSVTPAGGTPSYPALRGTYNAAIAHQAVAPNEFNVVVFVTDGEPADCLVGGTAASTNQALANDAESTYLQYEIPTYTVCMTGANCTALDTIAQRGGTGQSFTIDSANAAQVAQDLKSALLAIAGQNASCTFALPNVGGFDPNAASVIYTPGVGTPQTLTRQSDLATCGTGWYYDDPTNPTGITLCPTTCTAIQADTAARVEIGLGCPRLIGPDTRTEIYEGICPTGSGPQWGFLSYSATIPGDSSIRFQIRGANTIPGLTSATWKDLVTAPPAPAVCQVQNPPVTGCPVDVYAALQPVDARLRFVELGMTFTPTSNKRSAPTLTDWRLTYSCQPNQ